MLPKLKLAGFLLIFLINIKSYSQDNKTVILTVSGQGKTYEEAKFNALRSAIEQAFGTFISSDTKILNDEIIKDEIVSITNGNIQNYNLISQIELPNGEFSISLNATVSVTKLTSFFESKGVEIEYKGSLFAFNVQHQILNESNESIAIDNLCTIARKLADVSFNYQIEVGDPVSTNSTNYSWKIPLLIRVSCNNNLISLAEYFNSTLKGLSLSNADAQNYIALGKIVYPVSFAAKKDLFSYALLRNKSSIIKLLNLLYYFNHSILNFSISNGLSKWSIDDFPEKLKGLADDYFRIFLKIGVVYDDWGYDDGYCPASVFLTDICKPCNLFKVDSYTLKNKKIILDYRKWSFTEYNRTDEPNFGHSDYLTGTEEIDQFQTEITIHRRNSVMGDINTATYFVNQFDFILKLKKQLLNKMPGLVISFSGISPSNDLIFFYLEDNVNLDMLKKIDKYKIINGIHK